LSGLTNTLAKRRWALSLWLLILCITAVSFVFGLGGDMFHGHLDQGQSLMAGVAPANPGFPMWGYSFLADLFGETIVFFQLVFVVSITIPLYRTARKLLGIPYEIKTLAAGLLFTALLIPWFFLTLSYWNNSVWSLFSVAAYLLLVNRFAEEDAPIGDCALVGLLLGLAYNFRTESLMTAILLTGSLLICWRFQQRRVSYLRGVSVMAATMMVCLVPYLVFTSAVFGKPRLTTTNGGGVAYRGLGYLPDNPWNAKPYDVFVRDKIASLTDQGPWSLEGDEILGSMFYRAVSEHPWAFARRLLVGLRMNLLQGLHLPRIDEILYPDERDRMFVDLLRERLKARLGLDVKEYQLESYADHGIRVEDVHSGHYAALAAEFAVRALYGAEWLLLVALSALAVFRNGLFRRETLFFLSFFLPMLFVSMAFQTIPRHTASLLPITLLFCIGGHADFIREKFFPGDE